MGGRKNRLPKYQIITNGSMASATLTSSVTNIQGLDNIGVQLVWTGSPVGTFSVQVSIDYAQDAQGNVTNAGNWNAIALDPDPTATLGSPIYLDLQELSAPWLRVFYEKVSGSGTLNAYISGKML